MAGLPGTGKTSLAKILAAELAGTILSKDQVRHAIFAPGDIEYSTEQDDFCMELMLQAAEYILRKDARRAVFLDGRTFSRNCQVQRVIDFASNLKQAWRILECVCSDETARRRLEQPSDHPARNRNYELYLAVEARFEPICWPKVVLNTDMPLDVCVATALQELKT